MIKKTTIFLFSLISFIAGVGFGKYLTLDLFWLYITCISLVVAVFISSSYLLKSGLIIICLFLLGVWRYQFSLFSSSEEDISFYNQQQKIFIGIISEEPERRLNTQKIIVQSSIFLEPSQAVRGRVLINAKLFPEFSYGDRLEISCKLQAPTEINGFAYDQYLSRDQIYSTCYYPTIKLTAKDQGNPFFIIMYKMKNWLRLIINQSLTEPHASLTAAMMIGDRSGLSQEWLDKFSKTGIIHIVSVSGLHMSILAMILFYVVIFVGLAKNRAFYFVVFGLVIYTLMIGAPPSAVRSGIMVFLVLLAFDMGRLNKSINALALAAVLILVFNPQTIADIGFQLSFLAVLGLLYIFPWLDKITSKLPSLWGIKSLLLITLSAQLATLPATMYHFGTWSWVAPLTNLLIVPIIPLMMASALAMMFSGIFWLGLAKIIGIIVWLTTSYLFFIVQALS